MKRILLAACLAIVASASARAADTLTITIVSDSPVWAGTASKSWTFSQVDMTTFLNWTKSAYQAPACVPVDANTPCVTVPHTVPQSLAAWANGFLSGTKANVVNWQQNSAVSTAVNNVTPIDPK